MSFFDILLGGVEPYSYTFLFLFDYFYMNLYMYFNLLLIVLYGEISYLLLMIYILLGIFLINISLFFIGKMLKKLLKNDKKVRFNKFLVNYFLIFSRFLPFFVIFGGIFVSYKYKIGLKQFLQKSLLGDFLRIIFIVLLFSFYYFLERKLFWIPTDIDLRGYYSTIYAFCTYYIVVLLFHIYYFFIYRKTKKA